MMDAHHAPGWLRTVGVNIYGWNLRMRRFDSVFRRHRKFLEESQYWSLKQIEDYQLELLHRLLKDVAVNVPFYGKHFATCGFRPSQLSCLDDLARIEPIGKNQLREAGRQCLHKEFSKFKPLLLYSSGTTGEKFAYYVPQDLRYSFKFATIWRHYAWAGIEFLDRRVTLGARIFSKKPPYWVVNTAENQLLLSIHHLNEKTVGSYVERIKRFVPVFLQGHPTGIDYVATYLNNLSQCIPLKALFTTGETLFPEQRRNIEKAFQCGVYEEYGQGECVFAAQESSAHCGLHEVSEMGLIEFDKIHDNGFREVLGTSLLNYAMPFIRYRLDDLVEPSTPQRIYHGQLGLPVKIKRVIGRTDESIRNTRGQTIFPVSVRMSIKPHLKIGENYQVVQTSLKDYKLTLTTSPHRDAAPFCRALTEILGNDANIRVEYSNILLSPGGKVRNVINRCPVHPQT